MVWFLNKHTDEVGRSRILWRSSLYRIGVRFGRRADGDYANIRSASVRLLAISRQVNRHHDGTVFYPLYRRQIARDACPIPRLVNGHAYFHF